jgi:5S rRNA maturation endonuclease (ribonuclease M5)
MNAIDPFRQRKGFRQTGKNQYEACCPGHEDKRASLSISIGDDGRVLLNCKAGCKTADIVAALGLSMRDLFPQSSATGNGGSSKRIAATYDYLAADGNLVFQVVRFDPKDFRQRRPDGNGGHVWNIKGVQSVPYNLPDVLKAEYVSIVEGEKDVENLRKIGLTATCNAGGAGKWTDEHSQYFNTQQHVTIIPDNDEPGRKHAEQVAKSLFGKVASIKILRLEGLPEKGDVSDWLQGRDPEQAAEELSRLSEAAPEWKPEEIDAEPDINGEKEISANLFFAFMQTHQYIYAPDCSVWPASSVNARVKVFDDTGKQIKANEWLDKNRPVEQITWAPGKPMIIEGRLVIEGGWLEHSGSTIFNLYRPAKELPGDAEKANEWIEHTERVYPSDAKHIIKWMAHRVQRPWEKINHALVLGGFQGIGKDTILEPVKYSVGPWNFAEIAPAHLLGRFNGFLKSVILRISEARDLGDLDRFKFYDHLKSYTAAPPDVLRCDEKHLREYSVFNLCGVVITTNYKAGGIYLPADDRRHYVAWSDLTKEDFNQDYWTRLYSWYERGGHGHVAAYLRTLDISDFNPKAPPPKTDAFWAIVDASRAPEDSELADSIEMLGNPNAFTLAQLIPHAPVDFAEWLKERKNAKLLPHRMESVGYEPIRNPGATDGRWMIDGKKQVVYAMRTLCDRDRITAARGLRGGY